MKRIQPVLSLLFAAALAISLLSFPAAADSWPQFLGDPAAQGISGAQTPTSGSDTSLRWERLTGTVNAQGETTYTWCDVPGTPITVGNYVYYYSSQHLRKIDLSTGNELASAPIYGKPVNQFFINIAYGEGKIFVPCQTDNLEDGVEIKGCFLRVFDAETLEQLYVTESLGSGQPQSPVMYHDGYFVTGIYGRNGIYAGFTAEDEDPTRPDEIKSIAWSVDPDSKYGFSFNGAAFVGSNCYFGCDNILYVVNYKTGATRTFDIGEGYSIHSTITYSAETRRLYVACNDPAGGASVFSYTLEADGMPQTSSRRSWASGTVSGGTQSSPIVYKGRLYLGGGGHTMGSNEPFHVIDAITMQEIYSVPILSKGSAAISTAYATEENGWQVYIYMVPYQPNDQNHSELWILTDRQGQTTPQYEIVDNIGHRQFCSQSIAIAQDGSLIWYNDAARLYCYENTHGIFADTAQHWAREHIAYLARNGIVNGVDSQHFNPNGTITRAHFAQILANMSGDDLSACTTDAFQDVTDQWFAPAVAWAASHGIADTASGTYRPNAPITREEMALMLYRYAEKVAKIQLPAVNAAIRFTDASLIRPEAVKAISAMQRSGVINGVADGSGFRFAPQQQATRGQAAAMLARFCQILQEQGGSL